jgi:outer membrane protein assembly factor BamD (BamD/ComL family)
LWGIAETASALGARSQAEQALTDLIREFPDSPYAEVARARTAHGSP